MRKKLRISLRDFWGRRPTSSNTFKNYFSMNLLRNEEKKPLNKIFKCFSFEKKMHLTMCFRNISVNFKVRGYLDAFYYRPPCINYVVNKPSTENSKICVSVNICPIELIFVSIES